MQRHYRAIRYYTHVFFRHDLKAGITVFFVALPLCLGISLASGAPLSSGIIAGIVGGLVVTLFSRSPLSVSGPAAGLTAICASAITELGALQLFFLAVSISGILQLLLGLMRMGSFTHLIPSAVIKGMLAAIGLLLIAKQIPLLIGYDQPDFWNEELVNLIRFTHGFRHINRLYESISLPAALLGLSCFVLWYGWDKYVATSIRFLPSSFVVVFTGSMLAYLLSKLSSTYQLHASQYLHLPSGLGITWFHWQGFEIFAKAAVWKNAILICIVASLETLLSIEAIDKLDPFNRLTPRNRELVAQGIANSISGILGGLPITAVIVRSSANAEAGARTRLSAFSHGIWLAVAVLIAAPLINGIPYCVLSVVLIRTGYHLAKPSMIISVYKRGREQFLPFLITVIAILVTDLLIGVLIGIVFSVYFLIKHTYRAGFTYRERWEGHIRHVTIDLALNVSFLNKKRIREVLDKVPPYSMLEIVGTRSVYIDHDVLEIFHDYRMKAHNKHIQLTLKDVPDVETIELH